MSAKEPKSTTLGELEIQTLEFIWSQNDSTAKDAFEHFGLARGITLNTVQSTLERLYRKGYLNRTKASHAYRYSAAVSRASLLASLINDVLGRFGADSVSSAAAFVDAAQQIDEDTLQLLEEAIRKRREEEKSK